MSGYNNIGDKKVYIKTFNTYQMNDDHTFIGLRNTKDIECIERVYTQPAIFFLLSFRKRNIVFKITL